jgi:deoxyuridine 5'-triphosphate nucleotidohydrolase
MTHQIKIKIDVNIIFQLPFPIGYAPIPFRVRHNVLKYLPPLHNRLRLYGSFPCTKMSYQNPGGLRRSERLNESTGPDLSSLLSPPTNQDTHSNNQLQPNDNNDPSDDDISFHPNSTSTNTTHQLREENLSLEPPEINQHHQFNQHHHDHHQQVFNTQNIQQALNNINNRLTAYEQSSNTQFETMQRQFNQTQTTITALLNQLVAQKPTTNLQSSQSSFNQINQQQQNQQHQQFRQHRSSSSNQQNSPDPPASSPPRRNQQYQTPRHTQPQSNPNTNNNNRQFPTPPSIPPQYEIHSPPAYKNQQSSSTTPTIIVQKEPRPLKLNSYNSTKGYSQFRYLSFVQISAHPDYSSIINYDNVNNKPELNKNMTTLQSRALYLATVNAMGSNASEVVSRTQNSQPDGIALWKALDDHFLRVHTSHVLKLKSKKEYDTMKKESNESFTQYVARFEAKLEKLEFNSIDVGSHADIVYRLLDSLNYPEVFNRILMNLESEPYWYQDKTLRTIMHQAEEYYNKYQTVYNSRGNNNNPPRNDNPNPRPRGQRNQQRQQQYQPSPSPAPSPAPAPAPPANPYQRRNQQPFQQPSPRPQPSPSPSPQPQPPSPRPAVYFGIDNSVLENIRARITNSNNPTSTLHRLHLEHQRNCPLHNGAPHPIINCSALRDICQATNNFEVLNNTRNDLNLAPMPNSGLPALPPRNTQPSPAPQAQVRNPYNTPYNRPQQQPAPITARRITNAEEQEVPEQGNEECRSYREVIGSEYQIPVDESEQEEINSDNHSNHHINNYLIRHASILRNSSSPPSNKSVSFHLETTPQDSLSIQNSQITTNCTTTPTATSSIKAVCDSGASHNMSNNKDLFESITLFSDDCHQPSALMGDDQTALPIKGYGMLNFNVNNKRIRIMGYYVPTLGTTLISMKHHMRYKGCYFHVESNNTTLAYPTFHLTPSVDDEIELQLLPASSSTAPFDFDETIALPASTSSYSNRRDQTDSSSLHHHINLLSSTIPQHIPDKKLQQQFVDKVQIQRLIPAATIPTRATSGSIGFDVSTVTSHAIPPNSVMKIPTGLATSLPSNLYLRIAPRSSKALQGLSIEGGVVDSDYRGEIMVLIRNHNDHIINLVPQEKFAQFIFEKASTPLLQVCSQLPASTRDGGFGSTNSSTTRRIKSYSISPQELLIIDTSRRKNYKVRRVQRSEQQQLINPSDPITITQLDDALTAPTDATLAIKHTPPKSSTPPSSSSSSLSSTTPPTLPNVSVNAALPKVVSMTREAFSQSIGFRKPDFILKSLQQLSKVPISIQKDANPRIDPGECASMRSARRNTDNNTTSLSYSDVWHIDIGFGPCAAIGGIKYTLLMVDKATRYKLVYGLKNLTTSLLQAMQQFVMDAGTKPKLLRTDFDTKIIGGRVKTYLNEQQIPIQASPPYRQHQNGLVESHWQSIVSMTRNWLTSSLLPTKYWFYGIKRACEVTNILPAPHVKKLTTPHELVYKTKVDYRQLFPMFSIAYIKYAREGGGVKDKWKSRSLKCIAVGSCSRSNGLLFYHPPSKQVITCGNGYRFDTFSPAGPQFEERFDGNFVFSTQDTNSQVHQQPTHEQNTTVYIKDPNQPNKYNKAKILSIPVNENLDPYIVQLMESGDIQTIHTEDINDHDPSVDPEATSTNTPFPHLPWIQHKAKVTLFLNDRMPTPKQGRLLFQNNAWVFNVGRKLGTNFIELPNFETIIESMIQNKKIFQGWKTKSFVLNARYTRATSNLVANIITCRKVSAKDLHRMEAPTLLNHYKLHPEDKATWDAAYKSEYDGLQNIDTWQTITEQEYEDMKHLYKGIMPTMAISTIKYDGQGNPIRAKYRIVALGNLDPHAWTKQDCFAPVMSQLELRLLTALAVRKKCIPKTGDVTQAFCQSYLPDTEHYVCRPPPGCPLTPKGLYWRLKKTLYGLKRSPRHFYDLAKSILIKIGLKVHPSSPCLFHGVLIPGEPPIYLGLYVDDFFYFSESREVEKKFEKDFGTEIQTDFNGQVGYFLGINFTCKRHDDGNVSIHMDQEAFIDNVCQIAKLDHPSTNTVTSPYRSGHPVDTIPIPKHPPENQNELTHQMQVLIGCLTWLSLSTRPDIATITNLLAQYTVKATQSHINAAKRVIRYLKGTKTLGISFNSERQETLESHVKFPVDPSKVTSLCDANWGPQDQSKPLPNETRQVEMFTSRSLSGHIIYLSGPLHWQSKRQRITARSSAESEIYATDECTKCLLHIHQLLQGWDLDKQVMPQPTSIYNDNAACVVWSKSMTTKGLRHIQIRENSVREAYHDNFIDIHHIAGKLNLSDMFTKEEKDVQHFLTIRDVVLSDRRKLTNESHFLSS